MRYVQRSTLRFRGKEGNLVLWVRESAFQVDSAEMEIRAISEARMKIGRDTETLVNRELDLCIGCFSSQARWLARKTVNLLPNS